MKYLTKVGNKVLMKAITSHRPFCECSNGNCPLCAKLLNFHPLFPESTLNPKQTRQTTLSTRVRDVSNIDFGDNGAYGGNLWYV